MSLRTEDGERGLQLSVATRWRRLRLQLEPRIRVGEGHLPIRCGPGDLDARAARSEPAPAGEVKRGRAGRRMGPAEAKSATCELQSTDSDPMPVAWLR